MKTQRKNLVLLPTTRDSPNLREENPQLILLLAEPLVEIPSQLSIPTAVVQESFHQNTPFSAAKGLKVRGAPSMAAAIFAASCAFLRAFSAW